MSCTIIVGFLNGYAPHWADRLLERIDPLLPGTVRRVELELDLSESFAPERRQYNATLMLAALLRHLPAPTDRIVGVTEVDLFIPVLTFVFGQAQLDGPGAVVSTHRLHNEYYGLPPSETLLVDRTVKEVMHEIGHGFGLVHCRDPVCVMRAATYVEDVDLKSERFCAACQREAER